jgi:hypothetical protein
VSVSLTDIAMARQLRIDPPRNEPKVTIEVKSRSVNHCIAGHIVPQDGTLEVYESDVPRFMAEVEDREALSAAEVALRQYEAASAAKERGETVPDVSIFRGLLSLPAVFRQVNRRDMRALASVKRLDADKRQSARG